MIDGVVDCLDQHDDDWGIIRTPIEMEDLIQICLLRLLGDLDQLFSRPLCSSPQFVEAWKSSEFLQFRCRGYSSNTPHIAFFGSEQVHKGLPHTSIHPFHSSVQLCVSQLCTSVEQTQVRPEVILKKVGKSGGHCYDLLS